MEVPSIDRIFEQGGKMHSLLLRMGMFPPFMQEGLKEPLQAIKKQMEEVQEAFRKLESLKKLKKKPKDQIKHLTGLLTSNLDEIEAAINKLMVKSDEVERDFRDMEEARTIVMENASAAEVPTKKRKVEAPAAAGAAALNYWSYSPMSPPPMVHKSTVAKQVPSILMNPVIGTTANCPSCHQQLCVRTNTYIALPSPGSSSSSSLSPNRIFDDVEML